MSAGDRILKNTRQDKDLVINLNDGGTQASHFKIYGANPAIGIKDTGASYFLKLIATNTGISADKALTLDIGNINRLLSLQGNLTVESPSILNQDLTTDANVEFAQAILGNTGLIVGSSTPFSDAAGTLTLQNIDALDATTEATIENAIDTLVNLTSIQGQTISLSGDLTVETASIINQDLSSDSATAQLGTLTLTTKLIVSEISKASADLKLITTTSGDAELNPADDVRIKGDTANNVSNIQALFGSDGNGTDSDNSAGLRTSSSGAVQYKNRAGNWINIAAGATANQALSNLSSVAINTSLVSDANEIDDLGSSTHRWDNLYCKDLNSIEQFQTDQYLASSDFPNTTTLYGWRAADSGNFTTVYGGKGLTENGDLGSGTDHLDATKDCVFDGANDWLRSTDAAFNFTGDFSIGFWIYQSDWTNVSSGRLITRDNFSNGWNIRLSNPSTLDLFIRGAAISDTAIDTSSLSLGWHHFAIVRDNGSFSSTYIDGLLLSKTSTTSAIVAAGNLEIGSYHGGSAKFTGRITDVWVHNGTVWTTEQVKQIYARGSRRFASIDSNSLLDIQLPLEGVWFNFTPIITGYSATTTDDFVYCVVKNICYVSLKFDGTSNATNFNSSVPILVNTDIKEYYGGAPSLTYDNGAFVTDTGLAASSFWQRLDFLKAGTTAGWTAANQKLIRAQIFYGI